MPTQSVIVEFQYGSTKLDALFAAEEALHEAVEGAGCGEYDGHEIASDGRDGRLFFYGPDADRIAEVIAPVLASIDFLADANVLVDYEDSDADSDSDDEDDDDSTDEIAQLQEAKEMVERGAVDEALTRLQALFEADDPNVAINAAIETIYLQAALRQAHDVLTSIEWLEAFIDDVGLDLETMRSSEDEDARQAAQELDLAIHSNAATAYEALGDLANAISHAEQAVAAMRAVRSPGDEESALIHEYVLAELLHEAGRKDDAFAAIDRVLRELPTHMQSLLAKVRFLHFAGRHDEAARVFASIEPEDDDARAFYTINAPAYLAMTGNKAEMCRLLEDATQYWGGEMVVESTERNRAFDAYREDPDFVACLARCRERERTV